MTHHTPEEVVRWVNEFWKMKEAQRQMGRRYRTKQQILANLAKQFLAKDELERVVELAAEQSFEGRKEK